MKEAALFCSLWDDGNGNDLWKEVHMQVTEIDRRVTCSGEIITEYKAGKLSVQLIDTFEDRATLDDLLYSIGSQRIAERFWEKRDNIVRNSGFGIIEVGK